MAGLLNMGGLGGMSPGISPGLLKNPVMSQLFDPTAMRNYQIKRGLLGAGSAMMNPDPKAPPANFLGVLGRGASGGANSYLQAEDDFYKRGMQNIGLMELQRQYDERDQQKAAMDALIPTLPPDIQNFARAYPKEFGEAWMKAKVGGGEGSKYGLNPVWAQDEQGDWQLYQPNQQGGDPNRINFPAGIKPQPQTTVQDFGTYRQPITSRGGLPVGEPMPIDIAGKEREQEIGKDTGEAIASYRSMKSKMPGLETVVAELDQLSEAATYTAAGQLVDEVRRQTGQEPRESAVARARYISMVDNQVLPLLRDTFGAQFTEREGATLRATLGDPNKSPQEKQAVLKSFIEQKRRDVEALALQSMDQDAPGAAGGAADPLGIR